MARLASLRKFKYFSIAVVGGALHHRARAASIKGMIQVAFGLGIAVEIVRKLIMGFDPVAPIIIVAAGLALIGNLACLVLLSSQRNHDINMKSVWLCSRNDVISNAKMSPYGRRVDLEWVFLYHGAANSANA